MVRFRKVDWAKNFSVLNTTHNPYISLSYIYSFQNKTMPWISFTTFCHHFPPHALWSLVEYLEVSWAFLKLFSCYLCIMVGVGIKPSPQGNNSSIKGCKWSARSSSFKWQDKLVFTNGSCKPQPNKPNTISKPLPACTISSADRLHP